MAQLALKGHATRGKDVIELLEMLGGKNIFDCSCHCIYNFYYINEFTKGIQFDKIGLDNINDFTFFTIKEFFEKYPYKVGDKVIYKSEALPIIGMKWDCYRNIVIYTMKTNCGVIDCYDNTWMKPYKEETMGEIKINIHKGYEFARISND